MNYEKIYNQIILRAKSRELNCYVERHHVIPKCMGGTNDKDNLVKLTAMVKSNDLPLTVGQRLSEFTLVDNPTMDEPTGNSLLKSSGWLKQEEKTKIYNFS